MISDKIKKLLNKFTETQPALQDISRPFPQSAVKLGDLLDEAHGSLRSTSYMYAPLADGGTAGQTYNLAGANIPQGAIITRAYIAEGVDLVGDVGATLDLQVGTTSLTNGAQGFASFDGVQSSIDDFSATLPETTSGGPVKAVVASADLTAGQLQIFVEYIYPVK